MEEKEMSSENNLDSTFQALFKGMEGFITTKTVVGEAMNVDGTIIVPLSDVSFGMGAGAAIGGGKNNGGGGASGKMSPSAVLVIQNGTSKVINIKNQDSISKILDMVPDVVAKFTNKNDTTSTADVDLKDVKFAKDDTEE